MKGNQRGILEDWEDHSCRERTILERGTLKEVSWQMSPGEGHLQENSPRTAEDGTLEESGNAILRESTEGFLTVSSNRVVSPAEQPQPQCCSHA